MRRRDVISLLVGAGVVWPCVVLAQQSDATRTTAAFEKARRAYERLSHPDEAARSDYLTRLVRMREKAARRKTEEWRAIDAEIARHPAPKDSDSATLSKLLVGEWQSPRHDYRFSGDGKWTMLPVEDNTTNGTWRIEGNQYFDTATVMPDKPGQFTILLLTKKDFAFTKDGNVFYEKRLK